MSHGSCASRPGPSNTAAQNYLKRALLPLFSNHPVEATLLATSVAIASVANTRIWVEFSTINGASQTALNQRHVAGYWYNRRLMFIVMVKLALASSLEDFCVGRLCLQWRNALTRSLLDRYLPAADTLTGVQQFPFYRMKMDPDALPNPDQRIADDVAEAVDESVDLARALISNAVSFASWSWVLWRTSPKAFQGLLIYALFGTVISVCGFSKGLVRSQHNLKSSEAHFRFALVRVDECAESVAFYNAANTERNRLLLAFASILRACKRQLYWKLGQGTFQRTYSYVTMILPSMILAPAYFRGEVELGAISHTISAFSSVKQVLMFIANNFGVLSNLQAKIRRLEDLHLAIERASAPLERTSVSCSSEYPSSDSVTDMAEAITLNTSTVDDGSSVLLRVEWLRLHVQAHGSMGHRVRWLGTVAGNRDGSCFELGPGTALLIKGSSGVGKSSLLRAVAGLWKEGSGRIQRTNRVFFLPQTPYIPIGAEAASSSLKEQLLFPSSSISDTASKGDATELCMVLGLVGLGHLAREAADLDSCADWASKLSGGEKQRLAFARLLIGLSHEPGTEGEGCLVLLDEATSSCDEELEGILYEALVKRLRKGALVSVGHRSSLSQFHTISLNMRPISHEA